MQAQRMRLYWYDGLIHCIRSDHQHVGMTNPYTGTKNHTGDQSVPNSVFEDPESESLDRINNSRYYSNII